MASSDSSDSDWISIIVSVAVAVLLLLANGGGLLNINATLPLGNGGRSEAEAGILHFGNGGATFVAGNTDKADATGTETSFAFGCGIRFGLAQGMSFAVAAVLGARGADWVDWFLDECPVNMKL